MRTRKNIFQKTCASLSAIVLAGTLLATTVSAGTYLSPVDAKESDIMSVDFRADKAPEATYWAVMNWNAGAEGGGYAGFQMHANNRTTVHFAEWESKEDPINKFPTVEYASPISRPGRFGGEGEGVNIPTDYDWEINKWYNMTVRTWQENGETKIGQWVKNHEDNTWLHTGVINFPIPDIYFTHSLGMFQEDFWTTDDEKQNGEYDEQASLKNSYGRNKKTGEWDSWHKQNASAQDQYINNPKKGWAAGVAEDNSSVWIGMGGKTQNNGVANNTVFEIDQPATPELAIASDFSIEHAVLDNNKVKVKWNVPTTQAPYFSSKIELYDNAEYKGQPVQVITHDKTYENSLETALTAQSKQLYAKISLTNIFDETTTKKTKLVVGTPSDYDETPTNDGNNSNSNSNTNSNSNQSNNMLGVSIQFEKNKVQYTLPASLHRGKFRVVAFQNGKYIGESYENHAYYSTIDRSNPNMFVISPKDVTLKNGDQIEIYLMEDAPGHPLNKNNAQLLASKTY